MLAANPINYAMPSKLSSAEALAGSLYILGEQELAVKIMDKFKWGHTFLELNFNLLKDYAQAKSISEVMQLEREYFSHLYRE
jgi:pre-rRNA-processing protein TSR3